jgi:hypothetical protein
MNYEGHSFKDFEDEGALHAISELQYGEFTATAYAVPETSISEQERLKGFETIFMPESRSCMTLISEDFIKNMVTETDAPTGSYAFGVFVGQTLTIAVMEMGARHFVDNE